MKQNLVKSTYLVEGAFSGDNNIPRYQCVCCAVVCPPSRGYGNTQKKCSKDLIKVSFTSKSSSSSSFRFQPTKSYSNFTNPTPQIGDTNMTCKFVTNQAHVLAAMLLSEHFVLCSYIRVFHKIRQTGHQYPLFGPKPGEIFKKKPAKKQISLQGAGDMPFWAWPHTGIAHGGAPWWCEMVPSWSTGV
jgi:hypothetical protein